MLIRVIIKTYFWFCVQAVGKNYEAPGFIEGRAARMEHAANELSLDKFSQPPPLPYPVGKVNDAFPQSGSRGLPLVHQLDKQFLIFARIFTGHNGGRGEDARLLSVGAFVLAATDDRIN